MPSEIRHKVKMLHPLVIEQNQINEKVNTYRIIL